jgi:hypothetical protein
LRAPPCWTPLRAAAAAAPRFFLFLYHEPAVAAGPAEPTTDNLLVGIPPLAGAAEVEVDTKYKDGMRTDDGLDFMNGLSSVFSDQASCVLSDAA